jgi:hypothetical protein
MLTIEQQRAKWAAITRAVREGRVLDLSGTTVEDLKLARQILEAQQTASDRPVRPEDGQGNGELPYATDTG